MDRKALFFDIDGTLLSEITHRVPVSAKEALKEARKRGHLIFINSGRTFCLTKEILGMVEADGCLCGCGTYIEAGGNILYHHQIPLERGNRIKKDIVAYGLDGVLESMESCCMQKHVSRMPKAEHLKRTVKSSGILASYGWENDQYVYDKFCVMADEESDRKGFFKSLEPDIQVIDRGEDFYECVPRDHSKATAIQFVLKHYGIPLESAYVFGDSTNDLSMFEYATHTILMGKHDSELEPYAEFITKTVEEDGIAFAMKRLGIIPDL
ncbi:MAG: HAD family phosphatase [Lachnospiraceae bacterium]|jgi:Cof subfamily protein (haloacid dehalogenase superfamily)|nr:HAD family phosphatase [Lachnospiraceae bacterium]